MTATRRRRWAARAACALLAAVMLSACTARQGYEGLRTGSRNDCALQPPPEYERCLQRLEMDYDTYRAQPPGPEQADGPAAVSSAPSSADRGDHAVQGPTREGA